MSARQGKPWGGQLVQLQQGGLLAKPTYGAKLKVGAVGSGDQVPINFQNLATCSSSGLLPVSFELHTVAAESGKRAKLRAGMRRCLADFR